MRTEGWVEGFFIVVAWALLLLLSRVFRWGFFGQGTIAAGLALTACWAILASLMSLLGFVPALGMMLLIAFPALEEAVRAFFVYAVLPGRDPKASNYLYFAAGYASVEVLYKICLSIWMSGLTHFDELGTFSVVAVSGSALFFFGVLMCALRALGLPSVAAFVFCAVLHSAHNIAASSLMTGEYPRVVASLSAVFGYLFLAGIAFHVIRSTESSARV